LGGNENVPGYLPKFPRLAVRSFLAKEMSKYQKRSHFQERFLIGKFTGT